MTDHTPPTDEPTIDAIPTTYAGVQFRSRLEADWAATLNANHIQWQYEPETITLPSGSVYLPDFWLPELGTWIEAKGPGIPRVEKPAELAKARACQCTDTCDCQWPGGEFVLLGRTPLGVDYSETGHRPRCGYANWETPFGPSAYYLSCSSCLRAQWITMRRPWRCRACRSFLEDQTAHRAADRVLRFLETTPNFGSAFALPDLGEPFTEADYAEPGRYAADEDPGETP